MSAPYVSIIVPVYNSELYLKQCLESLLTQSIQEIEVICVDDGSTDCSSQILDHYAERDNRMYVIHQQNSGVSEARNAGLQKACGHYYMFVDSDDWLDCDCCQSMYEEAIKCNADVVMCSYTKEFGTHSVEVHILEQDHLLLGSQEVKSQILRRIIGPVKEELHSPQNMDILVTPCMQLFRTEKLGDERFPNIKETGTFEDGLYQIKLYQKCDRFLYMDKAFYHYRKTNSTSITSSNKPDLFKKWVLLFKVLEDHIMSFQGKSVYNEALSNRICISMIGLGLNQIYSHSGLCENSKEIRGILSDPIMKTAFHNLEMSWFPAHWKLFFFLCRKGYSLPLVLMLYFVEMMRKIVRKNVR